MTEMSKHLSTLALLFRTGSFSRRVRAARGRHFAQRLALAATLVFLSEWLGIVSPASAQRRTITVFIDSTFQARATEFLTLLRDNIDPEGRDLLLFEPRVIPSKEIATALKAAPWEMAILSTIALTETSSTTVAAAFEMPFVFPTTSSVITLQQSPLGHAGLSTISSQGMTGLAYLNAGVTLVAGRGIPTGSPKDLAFKKVGVASIAQDNALQNLGLSTVILPPNSIKPALVNGDVDTVAFNAGNPANLDLIFEGGYLLRDSVKANVAVVVVQNKAWEGFPFTHRAMIGDAAVAASYKLDEQLIKAEDLLFDRAKLSKASLINFDPTEASLATSQWISRQPEHLRDTYQSVLKQVNSAQPRPIPAPRRGGQVGKIYFATTREDTGSRTFGYRFGDARTDVMTCGKIDVPTNNPNGTPTIAEPVTRDNAACGQYLNQSLRSSKRMLIFVHGFNNRFSEAVDRGLILRSVLGPDTDVLVWSWPSKRDGLSGDYRYDKESAVGIAMHNFSSLLRALKTGSDEVLLSLLAHSMGSWHAIGALMNLADDDRRPKIRNVILAAPDVPSDEFTLSLPGLSRVSNRNTLYACAWDWALTFSQSLNSFPRAGTGGEAYIIVNDKLESIDVDADSLINHSYVFDAGKVRSDMTAMVINDSGPAARGLRKRQKTPWYYWHF